MSDALRFVIASGDIDSDELAAKLRAAAEKMTPQDGRAGVQARMFEVMVAYAKAAHAEARRDTPPGDLLAGIIGLLANIISSAVATCVQREHQEDAIACCAGELETLALRVLRASERH